MNYTIDTSDVTEVVTALFSTENALREGLQVTTNKAVGLYENAVAGFTPVNSGALRGSITTAVTGTPVSLHGEVVTDIIYGWPVEEGRRPGRMPPVDAIQLWVTRKLGIGGLEARRVAYVIARAIGRRGTKGAFMFKKGFEQMTPIVKRMFDDAITAAARAFHR